MTEHPSGSQWITAYKAIIGLGVVIIGALLGLQYATTSTSLERQFASLERQFEVFEGALERQFEAFNEALDRLEELVAETRVSVTLTRDEAIQARGENDLQNQIITVILNRLDDHETRVRNQEAWQRQMNAQPPDQ